MPRRTYDSERGDDRAANQRARTIESKETLVVPRRPIQIFAFAMTALLVGALPTVVLGASPSEAQETSAPPATEQDTSGTGHAATTDEPAAGEPTSEPAAGEPTSEPLPTAAPSEPATTDPAPAAEPAAEEPVPEQPGSDAEGGFEDSGDGAAEFTDEDLGGFEADGAASDEPDLAERRLVAYVATGVAAVAIATGGVFAFLAIQQYQCVADVVECNKTLEDPIIGDELFDARAEVEYKALAADMAFLFGAAAALVAATGYVRGFIFTGEDNGDEAADTSVTLEGMPPLPRMAAKTSAAIPASGGAPSGDTPANLRSSR